MASGETDSNVWYVMCNKAKCVMSHILSRDDVNSRHLIKELVVWVTEFETMKKYVDEDGRGKRPNWLNGDLSD